MIVLGQAMDDYLAMRRALGYKLDRGTAVCCHSSSSSSRSAKRN